MTSRYSAPRDPLKLIHTATPNMRRLSCLCRVRFGKSNQSINQSAVWIGFQTTQDCRRKKIWSLNTFRAIVQFTPAHQTRHREDRLVVSGRRCELGNSWIKLDQLGLFIDFFAKSSLDVMCFLRWHRSVRRSPCALATHTATSDGN